MVGRGGSHVSSAVDLANAAKQDGLKNDAIAALASLGASGKHSGNTERDLHTWVRGLGGIELEPYQVTLELQEPHQYSATFLFVS